MLDDFVGTGKTLLRKVKSKWKGKLPRFWENVKRVIGSHFEQDWILHVHHYVARFEMQETLHERERTIRIEKGEGKWFPRVEFSYGTILPQSIKVGTETYPDFMKLVGKYYDPDIESPHTDVGGGSDIRLGFGQCGLPLILDHNTPNNSVALLWGKTEGKDGTHAMRPLFRRRQRHLK